MYIGEMIGIVNMRRLRSWKSTYSRIRDSSEAYTYTKSFSLNSVGEMGYMRVCVSVRAYDKKYIRHCTTCMYVHTYIYIRTQEYTHTLGAYTAIINIVY